MFQILLVMIYLAFISLGLPDGLLGAAWPAMRVQMNSPMSYMGIISMIISVGTIVSSLQSHRLMPPLFGLLGNGIGLFLFPIYLVLILIGMVVLHERLMKVHVEME
ncbi:hypothetical protein [Streptococcus merionis]|uniref:Major facilitator superfamily protein n=1 Tax=Streptococcus merionis TaxID=400065 RepID=A0A239SW85_9STRE|nr:hypothetical protein [Streptococcus merionis]SNU89720.1 major facilitator superfamily protein [Streptococcus merionis]